MKLDQKEQNFVYQHRETLRGIFQKRLDDLQEQVFRMDTGEERDSKINFIQEFNYWLKLVKVVEASYNTDEEERRNFV